MAHRGMIDSGIRLPLTPLSEACRAPLRRQWRRISRDSITTFCRDDWLLPGCSWLFGEDGLFPDNASRYQTAPELAPIDVPPHLTTDAIQPDYPVPPIAESAQLATQFETLDPHRLRQKSGRCGADPEPIRRAVGVGQRRAGQLWPQVRGFLTTSGIGVAAVDAEAGLIDTQWFKLEDRELATRFRFRVDTGVQRNTAELHVLQQSRGAEDLDWPPESDDRDLERKMLQDVAQYLANSAESVPISMMADRSMSDSGRITPGGLRTRDPHPLGVAIRPGLGIAG
ncbi:MAG: hypothetical protein CM15mP74_21740 [Halieaceae bacterium]|nr:MAG: hypothetical protein CM15mP74_21740 [Halieaceae bacterium]